MRATRRRNALPGWSPPSSEYSPVGAGDGPENRDGPRRKQDAVDTGKPKQKGGRILSRHRRDASVRERLDDEDDHHEKGPEQDHRVHPPGRRLGEQAPEIEPPSHPEP